MRKPRLVRTILCFLIMSGCTVDGRVSSTNGIKHMICTDTRDGETFGFDTENITNVRIGVGSDSSFNVIDDSGKVRTMRKSMESYVKCVPDK